jgi:hypothetical protein
MGQATVDLPDPLESHSSAGLAGTDDLLAQLAGDEIDRHLGGADDAGGPASPPSPPRARPARINRVPAAQEPRRAVQAQQAPVQKHSAVDPAPPAPTASAAMEAEANAEEEDATAASLDMLLARLDDAGPAKPLPPPPTFEPAATPPATIDESDLATSDAERGALDESDVAGEGMQTGTETPEASVAPDEDDDVEPVADEVLPAYLRPLEWLNAPLDAMSESARDALGKAAILTLVNAVAVLLYVLIFRW